MSETVEVNVGVIGKPHGVKGDVWVEPRTDEIERRFAPGARLRFEDGSRELTVASSRWHAERMIVSFAEVLTREVAEALRGVVLVVDVPADEVPADPEEFYDRHLIGLRVLRHDGAEAGVVTGVLHPPTQDLLVIDTETGERLVPFTAALVPQVNREAGTCTLAEVPGLIDDDAEEVR